MSIKSLKTSTHNHQYVDSDIISRTKLIHTNRGWMSSTTKTLEMGLMAGAALVASGAAMVTSANADTVNSVAANTSSPSVAKTTDSLKTPQSITTKSNEKASAGVIDSGTKAPVSKASTSVANTVTNNTANDNKSQTTVTNNQKATAVQDKNQDAKSQVASSQKQEVKNSQTSSQKKDDAKPATQASSQKQEVKNSQTSSQKKDDAKPATQASSQKQEVKSSQTSLQKQDTVAKSNSDVTPSVSNETTNNSSNKLENKVSNTVASSDKSESATAEVEGKELPELTLEQTQLNNTIGAIQNSTYYTDEQKKALEELIKNGKVEDADSLPTNVLLSNGDKKMFISPNHAIFTNFSSVTDDENTHGTVGEALRGKITTFGPEVHLPQDNKVFTTHMTIDVEGQNWDAWCLQPMAYGPFEKLGNTASGTKMDCQVMRYDTKDILAKNAPLLGCAWYGYEGPAALHPKDDNFNVYTHVAMSVAAWDENFDNLRNYESQHDGVTQDMINKWRNIPEVKEILDKAGTFSQATMDNFNGRKYSFKAYSAHGMINGKLIGGSQDLFSVQWTSVPNVHVDVKSGIGTINRGAETTVTDTVHISGQGIAGQKLDVTNTLIDKDTGKAVWSGTQSVTPDNNNNADITFTSGAVQTSANKSGYFWETEVKGNPQGQNVDIKYNFDGKDGNEYKPTPKVDVQTKLLSSDDQKQLKIGKNVQLTDTVSVGNNGTGILNPNETYQISGSIIDKNTGKTVATSSASVKGTDIMSGNAKVVFTIPETISMQGHTLYANETVKDSKGTVLEGGTEDGSNNDAQQVTVPKEHMQTTVENKTAGDPNNGKQVSNVGVTTIVDHVKYNDLVVGQTYTISGTLTDKATGKPMQVNGKDVTSSVTFKATQSDGVADVTFTIDDALLQKHTYVAFEKLTEDGMQIDVHNDINDKEETGSINSSSIGTIAKNTTENDIGGQTANIGDNIKITDTVSYTNLIPGQTYTIEGTLMDKNTGKAMEVDGKAITASATFKPTKANGTQDVVFTLPNNHKLQGHVAVAYETLKDQTGAVVAVHNDINAKSQTVNFTQAKVATDANNTTKNDVGGKIMDQGQQMVITDTVNYSDLIKGQQYELDGVLMDKQTGKPVTVDGKEITATTTFTATGQNGQTQVVFTLPDDYSLQDHDLVAFETLKQDKDTLYVHADINDKSQTVHVELPTIHTDANNTTKNDVGGKIMDQGQQMVITDTVAYHGLVKGQQYTVNGVLMDKQTGKAVTVDGKEIDGSTTFTATGQDGTVDVTFTLPDDYSLQDHDLVAFETLNGQNGKYIMSHKDINDKSQTVHVEQPWIKTTLTDTTKNDQVTGDNKSVPVGENITLTDTVQYHGLVKGQTYVMNGTLMDKNTGKAVQVNGKDVTASTIFTATGQDGTTQVVFTLPDNINIQGDTLVAFESLNGQNGKVITTHQDINDKGQSVTNKIVSIQTELTDNTGEQTKGSHVVPVGDRISLIDHVKYTGLQPGEQFTMTGTLMDKETGKAVQVNGKDLTETVAFIPTSTDGEVAIHFLLPDDIALQGHELVAFESLKTAGDQKVVANHANWFDRNQTVKVGTPDLHTLATGENQSHNVVAGKNTVIVDQVQYHNLVPGQKYTVKGVLMDKQTGKAVMNNGKPVTAQVTFIPTTPNGTVSLTFKFDGTAYAGHQLVAFEDIYDEHGRLIERHEDINDLAETVNMIKPVKKITPQVGAPAPTSTPATPVAKAAEIQPVVVEQGKPAVQVGAAVAPGLPQTGDSNNEKGLIALAAAGLIGMIGVASLKSKKED